METVAKPESVNADESILVTELGIAIDVRFVHSRNALKSMLVTELGIKTEVRFLHPKNAL